LFGIREENGVSYAQDKLKKHVPQKAPSAAVRCGMLQLAMASEASLPPRKWVQPKSHDFRSSETLLDRSAEMSGHAPLRTTEYENVSAPQFIASPGRR
jgi:hypothetical protein